MRERYAIDCTHWAHVSIQASHVHYASDIFLGESGQRATPPREVTRECAPHFASGPLFFGCPAAPAPPAALAARLLRMDFHVGRRVPKVEGIPDVSTNRTRRLQFILEASLFGIKGELCRLGQAERKGSYCATAEVFAVRRPPSGLCMFWPKQTANRDSSWILLSEGSRRSLRKV